ncbi:MAG TPA: xylulokinase [Terriglobales bacterium]|nr:xylulokinase [Terriglobales bacterium]
MNYVLGIDVGTGGTRAVLIGRDGEIIGSATCEHVPFASPKVGWAEQDPHDWHKATGQAIRQVISSAGVRSSDILAAGLAGQMHGAVLLDENDEVLRPSLIWCDQRTQAQCDWLNEKLGESKIIELTSNPALTNFTLTKLLWVRDNEPAIWKRFRRVLLPKDYVRLRLTGEHAMDMAEASGTLMLDVAHRRWSEEMMDAAGLPMSCLPKLFESPEVCGRISAAGAAHTGLKEGTPVVAGAGDQAGGAVGMGIVRAGAVSATIGTSGVVFAATDTPAMDKKGRVHTFCHAVPGRWHVMGVTQAAGLSFRWLRDLLRDSSRDVSYDELTREAATVPAGSDGVLWAPYLMGERTPHLDPNARGTLTGLAASHTRGHVTRAILEGVAFSLKDTFSLFEEMNVPVQSIRLGGGGARSPLWRQIQADAYAHEVEILVAEEGAAYGAALLAGVGAKFWNSVDTACDAVVKVQQRVQPEPAAVAALKAQYVNYRQLYPALKPLFARMSSSA